jgi:prepilin peptidase CpaA
MSPHPLHATALGIAALAVVYDVRRRRVPRWVTTWALPLAPLAAGARSLGSPSLLGIPGAALAVLGSVGGAVLCALVPLLLFRLALIGGADVKLLATLGALLSPREGLFAEMCAFVLAAFLLPARLAYQGRLLGTIGGTARLAANPVLASGRRAALPEAMIERIPFTPFVLAGVVVALVTDAQVAP